MAKETDQFLEAEESAEKLVQVLQNLHAEINSYKTAGEELDRVREKLGEFVETTKVIARDTHDAVRTIKEIGGPKILGMLETLSRHASTESAANSERYSQLRTFLIIFLVVSLLSLIGVAILLLR